MGHNSPQSILREWSSHPGDHDCGGSLPFQEKNNPLQQTKTTQTRRKEENTSLKRDFHSKNHI
ncbi:MAG: hypothetical protein HUU45_05110 [Leptospiraceae bacterium]|nr:hypothetical protein [Leptospiraceae bacterium]